MEESIQHVGSITRTELRVCFRPKGGRLVIRLWQGCRSYQFPRLSAPVPSFQAPDTTRYLLVILLLLSIVNDVEELELVDTLGGGDDAEPVPELVLLEELLGAASPRMLATIFLRRTPDWKSSEILKARTGT